jgi:hypothetical protein
MVVRGIETKVYFKTYFIDHKGHRLIRDMALQDVDVDYLIAESDAEEFLRICGN